MPTGYTATLCEKGQSFPEFALQCARAFGALVMMRDDPTDTPIPKRFEPSDYNAKKLAEAKKELSRLEKMTEKNAAVFGRSKRAETIKSLEEWLERDTAANTRLHRMRAEVERWNPPGSDHIPLKEFMLDQLKISLNDTTYITKKLAQEKARLPLDLYNEALTGARRDIVYHAEEHRKEVERTESRNLWLQQLRASLSAENSVLSKS